MVQSKYGTIASHFEVYCSRFKVYALPEGPPVVRGGRGRPQADWKSAREACRGFPCKNITKNVFIVSIQSSIENTIFTIISNSNNLRSCSLLMAIFVALKL